VPWEWTSRWGLRRYGFHGLSHAWASHRAAELMLRSVTGLHPARQVAGGGPRAELACTGGITQRAAHLDVLA
jgi:acetate kinase